MKGLPSIDILNKEFSGLSPEKRIERLYDYFTEDEVLMSSSFGTTSIYLLHLIHRMHPTQTIYTIDTGFLFDKTHDYMDTISRKYNLNIQKIKPFPVDHQESINNQLWQTNPDLCCTLNKTIPFEAVKLEHKLWITGLLGFQNDFRSSLPVFEKSGGILKFCPIIDQSKEDVQKYIDFFELEKHPLELAGYGSVGCTHCTTIGEGRTGRWQKMGKTECGLHFNPVIKV